jgi:hypothetical protein
MEEEQQPQHSPLADAAPSAAAAASAPAASPPAPKEEAYPPHFSVLDAPLQARMLARLPAHTGGAGSKKRRREEIKATRSCYDWANKGACSYGDACRYSHDATLKPDLGNRGRNTLRALAQEREHLFVTGVAAGEAGAGGGGGGGGGGSEAGVPEDAAAGASSSSASSSSDAAAPAAASYATSAASAAAVTALLASTTSQERLVGPQVTPLSALARYYTRLYSPGTGTGASSPGWDTYVHLQANKCCVVGLAAAHPLLLHAARASPVVSLTLSPALAAPGGMPQLSGKRKKGAVWVEAETVLATAVTEDGRVWPLRAGMRGSLVEFNTRLLERPALLTRRPATQGHLAIILTDLKRVLEVTRGLLCEADYAGLCASRGLPVG